MFDYLGAAEWRGDLQSGHTRQVSTRSDDKLHAAMAKVREFRAIRRVINRPIKKIRTHGQ